MDAANVINRLISTADDLGAPGRDDEYGFGEVDPVAALTDTDIPTVGTANPLLPGSSAAGASRGQIGAAPATGGTGELARPDRAAPRPPAVPRSGGRRRRRPGSSPRSAPAVLLYRRRCSP